MGGKVEQMAREQKKTSLLREKEPQTPPRRSRTPILATGYSRRHQRPHDPTETYIAFQETCVYQG